jgi:putative transposase
MALDKSALLELTEALGSADGGQLMRRLLHTILQALIDAEAAEHIGADPHERTDTRTTYRNGTRDKTVATTGAGLDGQDHQDPHRVLLPLVVDPSAPDRCRDARGGDGGLRAQRLDPQARGPGHRVGY